MSESIIRETVTSKVRGSIDRRNSPKKCGCPDRKSKKGIETVIANSLFTLKLEPKQEMEIEYLQTGRDTDLKDFDEDFDLMFEDLHKCVFNGLRLLKKDINPLLIDGMLPVHKRIAKVLQVLEEYILPEGFTYNISVKGKYEVRYGGYYITIFKELDFDNNWHFFEIANILRHLKETNIELHDAYVEFLVFFNKRTHIDFWYNDTMAFCEEWLEEKLEEAKADIADEFVDGEIVDGEFVDGEIPNTKEYTLLLDTYNNYTCGEAKNYESLFRVSADAPITSESILAKLDNIPEHEIKEVIKKGLDIACMPYCISNYLYTDEYNYDEVSLEYEFQANIIWDEDDPYTGMKSEFIDATAREGVYPPIIFHVLDKENKFLDLEWLKNGIYWPDKLSNYWYETYEITKKYKQVKAGDNE